MVSNAVQFGNILLPSFELSGIVDEEAASVQNIKQNLLKLQDSPAQHLIPFLRLIDSHLDLKYEMNAAFRSVVVTQLLSMYEDPSVEIPLPVKSKLFGSLLRLIEKKYLSLDVKLHWQVYWKDVMVVLTRQHVVQSSDEVLAAFVKKLVAFLHKARKYIPKSEVEGLLEHAMATLSDTRMATCFEGVLLLVTCMPTAYDQYDKILPKWYDCWNSINGNAYWDSLWATLFTRARKHATQFTSFCTTNSTVSQSAHVFLQFLCMKVKQLCALPYSDAKGRGSIPQTLEFPHSMPSYYQLLLATNGVDPMKIGINKITKLMYFSLLLTSGLTDSNRGSLEPLLVLVHPLYSALPDLTVSADILVEGAADPGLVHPAANVYAGTVEIITLFQSIRSFMYPSNVGPWTAHLAYFMTSFVIEISRHMARSYAVQVCHYDIPFGSPQTSTANVLHSTAIHKPTTQYLCMSLVSFVMEGLYGKSPMMVQFAASCIKGICSVDPAFTGVFVPYLLKSLDPAATNQSHQAPAAMLTFTFCFRQLMFPYPEVMLQYLPSLLQLSLPGLDPNDMTKTNATSTMYCVILSWIAVKKNYSKQDFALNTDGNLSHQSYLDQLIVPEQQNKCVTGNEQKDCAGLLTALDDAMTPWALSVIERVLLLLQAKEQKQKGQKSNAQTITSGISELVDYLFLSISNDECRLEGCNKFIENCLHNTTMNACKEFAKIFESIVHSAAIVSVESGVFYLRHIVTSLLGNEDILNGGSSSEKLAFRLRIVGGCMRRATGDVLRQYWEYETSSTFGLLHTFFQEQFIYHTDKVVRKAVGKVVKDVLRGLTGTYPCEKGCTGSCNALRAHTLLSKGVSGGEMDVDETAVSDAFRWYTPDTKDVLAAVDLLRLTVVPAVDMLEQHTHTYGDGANFKRSEERLVVALNLIRRCMRGSCEILGNSLGAKDAAVLSCIPAAGEQCGSVDNECRVAPCTTHIALLSSLSDDKVTFLDELRMGCVAAIVGFQGRCMASNIPGDAVGSLEPSNSPDSSSGALTMYNSLVVQKAWIKVLKGILFHGSSRIKEVDNNKQMHNYYKRLTRNPVTRTIQRVAALHMNNGALRAAGAENVVEKWRGVDLSFDMVSTRMFLQRLVRLQEKSRIHLRGYFQPSSPLYRLMHGVVFHQIFSVLLLHSYETIRHRMCSLAIGFISRIGSQATNMILPLFTRLYTPIPSTGEGDNTDHYSPVAGVVRLLSDNHVMKRLLTRSDSRVHLLYALTQSDRMLSTMVPMDKQTLLANSMSAVFVKYSNLWHILPSGWAENKAIEFCGDGSRKVETDESMLMTHLLSQLNPGADNGGAAALGLRHGCYAAFSVMHQLRKMEGHIVQSMPLLSSMWHWASSTMFDEAEAMPLHDLSLTTIITMSHLFVKEGNLTNKAIFSLVDTVANPGRWKSFCRSVSSCRPKAVESGEGAQWSAGVSSILRSSYSIKKTTVSRRLCGSHADVAYFSGQFNRVHAAMFMNLFTLWTSVEGGDTMKLVQDLLKVLFSSSKEEVDSLDSKDTEDEKNSYNTTCAEVIAGFYRSNRRRLNGSVNGSAVDDVNAVERVLSEYLWRQVDLVSLELSKVWAEAVMFSLCDGPVLNASVPSGFIALPAPATDSTVSPFKCTLVETSLERFGRVISPSSGPGGSAQNSNTSQGEGFAQHGKVLCVARAVVTADIMTAANKSFSHIDNIGASVASSGMKNGVSSVVGAVVAHMMAAPTSNITLSQQTSRSELSVISALLLTANAQDDAHSQLDVSVAWRKLVAVGTHCPDVAANLPTVDYLMKRLETHSTKDEGVAEATSPNSDVSATNVVVAEMDITASGDEVLAVSSTVHVSDDAATAGIKQSLETVIGWLQYSCHYIPLSRFDTPLLPQIVAFLLNGCGHKDLELSKLCHEACMLAVQTIHMNRRASSKDACVIGMMIDMLSGFLTQHPSWHVRESALIALTALLVNNWPVMTLDEKKSCKNCFTEAFLDIHPEIQLLSKNGVIVYLTVKSTVELSSLGATYTKNCDVLAEREKKRKRAAGSGSVSTSVSPPVDKMFMTTVCMAACMILAFPLDVPGYVPALLTSLTRHINSSNVRQFVSKTVQDFKKTHQDRWSDFKDQFTSDQLQQLQGAGAANYFS